MFLQGVLIGGRYRVIKLVDSGTQGMVFKAADEQREGKPVAIKILMATSPGSMERFGKEMLIHSKQRSPHILPIYEANAFEMDGKMYPYCVLPYIAGGKTLAHVFEEYRGSYPSDDPIPGSFVPLPRLMELMVQAGTGLRDAHRKDVVHRDFKPGNVLVYRDDRSHEVSMVMDFGIAKIVRENELMSTEKLTQLALGTPEYMAPQQGFAPVDDPERDRLRQDPRNDIYSFGATLYEGVTGHSPYPFEQNRFEVWAAVVRGEIQPDEISKYCTGIPDELEKLIMSCISRDMDKRPRDMDEVLDTLTRIRFDLPSRSEMDSEFPVGLPQPISTPDEMGHARTVYMPSTPPSFPLPPRLPSVVVDDNAGRQSVPSRKKTRQTRSPRVVTKAHEGKGSMLTSVIFLFGGVVLVLAGLFIFRPSWMFPQMTEPNMIGYVSPASSVPVLATARNAPGVAVTVVSVPAKPSASTNVIILAPPPPSFATAVGSQPGAPKASGKVRQPGRSGPIDPEGPMDPIPPM